MAIMSKAATIIAVVILVVLADPATAQDSRAEVIQNAQAQKLSIVTPPQPNRAERIIDRLEDWGLFAGAPRGLYPWVGSVYPGSGFTLGVGLRQAFADDGAVNTFGAYSTTGSTRAEAHVLLPTFARQRARVTGSGQYLDAAEVKYFGIGNDSAKEHLTYFGYTPKRVGAQLDVTATRKLALGGGVSYLANDASDLERVSVDYLNSTARAAFDWRRRPGYSGSGGFYRVQFDDYAQRSDNRQSFRSVEAEVLQLVPIMRANWVIAVRGLATLTDIDTGSTIPFFMLPSLGGGSTLRGYPDFRFRDRHRMLMTAEVRWTPARFLDMAVFYDTGKVAATRDDLNFDDLKQSYGIGARIVSVKGYILRMEVAHSREHAARFLFKAGGGL